MSTLNRTTGLRMAFFPLTAASPSDGVLFADNDNVRVTRRRPAGPSSTGPRQRVSAPSRERPSSGGGGSVPPSSGGGGFGGGGGSGLGGGGFGGLGGGMRPASGGGMQLPGGCMGIGGIIVIIILAAIFVLPKMFSGGSSEEPQVAENLPTAPPQSRPTSAPTRRAANATPRPAAAPGTGGTWTVMLYDDADDKILEKDIYLDLNEAERVGSSDNVNIVAQIDRYRGGFQGDGDWTSAKRFYVTQDDDLATVTSQEVDDLGEVNMADGATLVDFVTWAMQEYPADKYALILSDHGMGWPGGWSDPTATGGVDRSIPLEGAMKDVLYLNELDSALQTIREQSGLDKFELIGMDACLMASAEVFSALAPHARYAVASEETEPALGWAYTAFLGALRDNPGIDGAALSQAILDSYITDDQRIQDPQARADLVGRGQPMGGLFDILLGGASPGGVPSASEVADELGQNVTLTAVDLSAVPQLMQSVNDFALSLQAANEQSVSKARSYAQSFTSIFGSKVPPSYIDLGHFVQLFKKTGAQGASAQAADEVLAALGQAVIGEMHGPKRPGATGVSIYFPVSQLYRTPEAGPQSYTAIANRFAQDSLWDDYLAYFYTGQQFTASSNTLAVPERAANAVGPAAGGITVDPVTLSENVAAPGQPVLLSTHIEGENVGYVYLFAGFYDSAANSILTVDMDYLQSDDSAELNGIYYPVWPQDGSFDLEFEWEPIVFAISDGATTVPTLFQPETYGADPEEAIYTVDGTYTYADDGEARHARLYFSNGVLRQVFGFNGSEAAGAPREITPQAGDTFTLEERWMDLDANGAVAGTATEPSDTLTFSDQPFTWQEMDAAAGSYIVGFIVEDLDGNQTPVYEQIEVQ